MRKCLRSLSLPCGNIMSSPAGRLSTITTTTTATATRMIVPPPLAAVVPCRHHSTTTATTTTTTPSPPPPPHLSKAGMAGFTDKAFNHAAESLMQHLEDVIDTAMSSSSSSSSRSPSSSFCWEDFFDDVSLEDDGVLTIATRNHGTFVINKQAPKLQLWLSSPMSGPHHFDMRTKKTTTEDEEGSGAAVAGCVWVSERDGSTELLALLEKELAMLVAREHTTKEGSAAVTMISFGPSR